MIKDPQSSPAPPRSNWRGVIFGYSLSVFAAYQLFKLPPALPLLLSSYGYDRTLAGGFMSVFAVAGLALSLWIGRFMAREGPIRLLPAALGLMAAGNALALAVPASGAVLLAARALEGVAFAVLAIAGPVLASREASAKDVPLVLGLIATWIPVGQIIATLVAPHAFAVFGWQSLWLLGLLLCIALAAWVWRVQRAGGVDLGPARDTARAARPEHSGTVRFMLTLTAAIFMLWSGQYFAAMTWLPQYLIEAQGLQLSAALAGYLLPVVVLMVFNLVTGALLRAGAALGLLLASSLALQAAVWWLQPGEAVGPAVGLALLVVYGIGAGVTPTCLFALPNAILGHGMDPSAAFGIVMTGRNLGVLAGPIVLAEVYRWSGGWALSAPVFGAVTALALILAAVVAFRLRAAGHGTSR